MSGRPAQLGRPPRGAARGRAPLPVRAAGRGARPRPGCRTARRSRRCTTSPARARRPRCSRLEARGHDAGDDGSGWPAEPGLRAAYQAAHRDYLARRAAAAAEAGVEPLPAGTQSAGGMPDRVKCLHALAAHELAVPGANPLGREAARRGRGVVGGRARACRRMCPVTTADWMRAGGVRRPGSGWRPSTAARTRSGCWSPTWTRCGAGSPTWTGGWRSSGSARASTPPAGWRPTRWTARCACWRVRGHHRGPVGGRGPHGGDQRHPGRVQRGRVRPRGDRGARRRARGAHRRRGGPAVLHRRDRGVRRGRGRDQGRRGRGWGGPGRWRAGGRARAAVPGRGHRRRVDRVRAGRRPGRRDRSAALLGGHRLRPADRAAPALRPAHRRPDRRGRRRTSTPRWTGGRGAAGAGRPHAGRPGRLGHHGRGARARPARTTTRRRSTTRGSPPGRCPGRPAACSGRPARSGPACR